MHMRNLDLTVINQPKNHYNSMSLIVDEVIQDVMQFHNNTWMYDCNKTVPHQKYTGLYCCAIWSQEVCLVYLISF